MKAATVSSMTLFGSNTVGTYDCIHVNLDVTSRVHNTVTTTPPQHQCTLVKELQKVRSVKYSPATGDWEASYILQK